MSTTSQYTTFSDLYDGLTSAVRVQSGVTATNNVAKRLINVALQDIALGTDYKLPWLERRAVLITHATYTTGTVDVSVGGTTVTGTDSLWNTANSYGQNNARTTGKMTIAGGHDIYRVTDVASDTSLTIGHRYVPTSAADDDTYIYFEDEYALASDFLRMIDTQLFISGHPIPLISRHEFRERFPRPNVGGRPKVATVLDIGFGTSTTPVRRMQFYPYPDAVFSIPYTYVTSNLAVDASGTEAATLSSDTDEPNMPLRYRHLILLHALYNWYRDRRDDQRSQEVKAEYTDQMLRLLGDQEVGTHMKAQIRPSIGSYVRGAMRPYSRRGSRTYDLNGRFDRME